MEDDSDDSCQPNTEIRDTRKQANGREDRCLERERRKAEYDIESKNKNKQIKELERELEVCRNKCNGLNVELEGKKMECVGFEAKLEEFAQYKTTYNGFKQQMTCLKKMEKCYREKNAELEIKIKNLESGKRRVEDENEGLKRRFTEFGIESSMHKHEVQVERDDREKYSELEVKIRDLESGKRRVEGVNENLKRRFTELGIEFSRLKHEVDLEKVELEVRRTKYDELSLDLETTKMERSAINAKFEALMVRKIAVEDELKECRTVCNGLKEKITRIEKDQCILCGRETKAQETFAQLLEELKKKEHDKSGIYVQFKNDNREPEDCRRKIAEEETEIWKKKCNVYKITCSRLKERIREGEKMLGQIITKLSEELKKMERDEKEKYDQLEAENQDLEFAKRRAEAEFDDLKKRFKEFESQAAEELKKMEREEKEKCDQLKAENQDLEFEKRRAEAEIDVWKKRFKELETQAAVTEKHEVELKKELVVYRTNCDALSEELKKIEKEKYDQLKAENQNLEFEKRRGEDEIDGWKKRFCELESRVLRGTTLMCRESHLSGVIESEPGGLPTEVSHNDEKDDRNKTIELHNEPYGGDNNGALVVRVTGGAIDMQSLPVVNAEEDLEFGKGFGEQLALELEGNNEMHSVLKLGSIRPASGRIIDISNDSLDNSSVIQKDLAPKKCLKRLYSDQRGEIYGSRCNEDSPFTPSPKRKRASETPNASCGGLNVEEKNGWAEKTSPKEHTSLTQLDKSGKSNEKVVNHTAEEGKEKMEEDSSGSGYSSDNSDSKDKNLGGFKLERSDSSGSGYSSSDSKDSVDFQLIFDNAFKKIFNRDNRSNLKVEADKGAHKLQNYR